MKTPEELKYSKTHEWVRFTSETECEVGLSDYAQNELGDLVFVNLPQAGDEAVKGETICDVESVKAVSDVYAPVSGTITEVNEELLDSPEKINEDPYGTWIFRLEDVTGAEDLLDADAYAKHCEEEEHRYGKLYSFCQSAAGRNAEGSRILRHGRSVQRSSG